MNHPIHRVTSIDLLGSYRLRVGFADGAAREIDLEPVLEGEVYGPLRNPEAFALVKIDPEAHTLVWPNGADFDPAILHDWPQHEAAMRELAKRWAMAGVSERKLIFVNREPYRVWSGASPYRDQDLIHGLRPDLHLRLAKDLVDSLDHEDNDHAVLGLRLLYGLGLETFFALLFSMLQAPEAPSAWLLLYREDDLQELIERFQAGEDLPSHLVCSEPGSWEALAVMLFPSSLMEDETYRGRAKRLGALWAEWASEYLNKDMRAEFNSLKHGLRIRSAAPYLALDGHVIESDEHGSWFVTYQRSKSDVLLGVCARSWSGRTLYSRLKLITTSSRNFVEILKLVHRVGDTDRFSSELPDDVELDAAKPSGKPLVGLRFGPSWAENRRSSRLSYEEAIGEYRKLSGTFKIEGKPA